MKKVLLTLMSVALSFTSAFAYDTNGAYNSYGVKCWVDRNDNIQYIDVQTAGGFADFVNNGDFNTYFNADGGTIWKTVVFSGAMNDTDLGVINAGWYQDENYNWKQGKFGSVELIDFTNVTTAIKPAIKWDGYNGSNHMVIWPAATDPTKDDLVTINTCATYQGITNYAYYTGNDKKTLKITDACVDNDLTDITTYLRNLLDNGDLTFEALEFAYGWTGSSYVYTNVASNFLANVGKLPVVSLNLCGCNLSSLGTDFSALNTATNYIILPVNNQVRNASEDFDTYTWNDNVCVVAAYISETSPYGKGGNMAGAVYDVVADPASSITLTFVHKANTLGGGAAYLPSVMQNAEKMVLAGTIGADDIEAMNHMTCSYVDLNKATLASGADITEFDDPEVDWLAVPNNTRREQVDALYATLSAANTDFKGVVGWITDDLAETGDYQALSGSTLITYTAAEGCVYNLVYMIEETYSGQFASAVRNVIMSGNLNAFDICQESEKSYEIGVKLGTDGHLYATGNYPDGVQAASVTSGALNGAKLRNIDFTNAIFSQPSETALAANTTHCPQYYTDDEKKALVTDMNFVALAIVPSETLLLPTDESQKVIPADCMSAGITEICIPSNFQYVMDRAFNACGPNLDYIYTTADPNTSNLISSVVDNGEGTYTISSNVKYIAVGAFDTNTTCELTDVYVLALIAPVCEPNAFNTVKLIGNNGFTNTNPICRDNYKNNGNWITVLHFPNALDDAAKSLYTDIDREYFYEDETGAVDGEGNLLRWPNHSEFSRSWNQANLGYTWNEWDTQRCMPPYTGEGDDDISGNLYGQILVYGAWQGSSFETIPYVQKVPASYLDYSTAATVQVTDKHADCDSCGFASQIGWHQFLLASPGYFYEEQGTTYKQTPYYTFCIPYDMTYAELKEFLGTPDGKMPEVRTLRKVVRYTEATGSKKKDLISFYISKDLVANNSDVQTYGQTDTKKEAELVSITRKKGDADVYLKGGYPYIVKGWIPEGVDMPENLAKYVLAKANATNHFSTYDLGNVAYVSGNTITSTGMYDRTTESGFVKMPYFNHTIDAYDYVNGNFYGARNTETLTYKGKDGTAYDYDYKYNFCGHYEADTVYNPEYSYYFQEGTNGTFKRCTTAEDSNWDIYNCVITHHGYGDPIAIMISKAYNWHSKYVAQLNDHVWGGQYGEYDETEVDPDSNNSGSSSDSNSNFIFLFDEDVEGDVADGIVNTNAFEARMSTSKSVYTLSGQYVGESLKGLGKGIYVVNGQKYIVK